MAAVSASWLQEESFKKKEKATNGTMTVAAAGMGTTTGTTSAKDRTRWLTEEVFKKKDTVGSNSGSNDGKFKKVAATASAARDFSRAKPS